MQPSRLQSPEFDEASSSTVLPQIDCDPLASFPPTTIEIDAFGKTWVLPPMRAIDWLKILWSDELTADDIFPGLFNAQYETFEAMLREDIAQRELFDMAMEVIEAASGFKWWFALNLTGSVRAAWSRLGGPIMSVISMTEVSLGAFLAVALAVACDRVEAKKLPEFLNNLNTPPPEFAMNAFDEEAEGDAFLAAMRQSL